MKKIFLPILTLFIFLQCSKTEPQKKIEDKVIFEIENEIFRQSDFRAYIDMMKYELSEQKPIILSRIFDRFFDTAIVCKYALSQGYNISEESLKELGGEKNEKIKRIKEMDILYENFLMEMTKSKVSISKEEIEEYYKTHEEEFKRGESVRVYQILVPSESEALEILSLLKKSPPNQFEQIAKERSISPEGSKGGDMGYFQRGELPLEIEDVVFSLKVGELSPVVKSSFGYHIFKVVEKKGARLLPLKEVEKSIAENLFYQKRDTLEKELINTAKNNLKWKIYFENLPFNYIKGEENE